MHDPLFAIQQINLRVVLQDAEPATGSACALISGSAVCFCIPSGARAPAVWVVSRRLRCQQSGQAEQER